MYRFLVVFLLGLACVGCGGTGQVQASGDVAVTLESEPAPPLVDRPTMLYVRPQVRGAVLTDAAVVVMRSLPGMDATTTSGPVVAQVMDDGRYAAQVQFEVSGRWDVVVRVQESTGRVSVVQFPLEVEQP